MLYLFDDAQAAAQEALGGAAGPRGGTPGGAAGAGAADAAVLGDQTRLARATAHPLWGHGVRGLHRPPQGWGDTQGWDLYPLRDGGDTQGWDLYLRDGGNTQEWDLSPWGISGTPRGRFIVLRDV